MITDRDTNKVFFSPALARVCPRLWEAAHTALMERGVRHELLKGNPQYFWCRDYMPIQIEEDEYVSYHFRPDYLLEFQDRYQYALDYDGDKACREMGCQTKRMDLVVDGGNVVKCDDTIVMTEKVFVENATKNKKEVERILSESLKCDILFLPWDRENEKYGHSDGIIHYAGDGKVVMTNYHDFDKELAREMEKILGRKFEVVNLSYKTKRMHRMNWAYINFLQTERLIVVPMLELEEDEQALEQIEKVFPDVEVIGVPALEAVRKGGGMNCVTWNVKE